MAFCKQFLDLGKPDVDAYKLLRERVIDYLDNMPSLQAIFAQPDYPLSEENYVELCFSILIRDLFDALKTTDGFEKQKWCNILRSSQKPNGFFCFNLNREKKAAAFDLISAYPYTALGITVLELLDCDLKFPLFNFDQFTSVEVLEDWLNDLNQSQKIQVDSLNKSTLKGDIIVGLYVLLNKALHDGLINAESVGYLKAWCDSQASPETGLWCHSNSDFKGAILFDVFWWTRLYIHHFHPAPYPERMIKWLLDYRQFHIDENRLLLFSDMLISLILGGIYPLITSHRREIKRIVKKYIKHNHRILFSSSNEPISIEKLLHLITNKHAFPDERYFTKSNIYILYLYLASYAAGSKLLSGYRYSLSGWKLHNQSIYSSFYPVKPS